MMRSAQSLTAAGLPRLSNQDAGKPTNKNYGHPHATFGDGSAGLYEAGLGPMMSGAAFFVKDIVGPNGSVSFVPNDQARTEAETISGSAHVDKHTKTDAIRIQHAEIDSNTKEFARRAEILSVEVEPGHQKLCNSERAFFLRPVREGSDLSESLRVAWAASGSCLRPSRASPRNALLRSEGTAHE